MSLEHLLDLTIRNVPKVNIAVLVPFREQASIRGKRDGQRLGTPLLSRPKIAEKLARAKIPEMDRFAGGGQQFAVGRKYETAHLSRILVESHARRHVRVDVPNAHSIAASRQQFSVS